MRYFHGYLIQKCSEASLCLNDGENLAFPGDVRVR